MATSSSPIPNGSRRLGALGSLPAPLHGALIGGASFGAIGSANGLAIGLSAYPPTAWFAMFEVGIPATIVGILVGSILGGLRLAVTRVRGSNPTAALRHTDHALLAVTTLSGIIVAVALMRPGWAVITDSVGRHAVDHGGPTVLAATSVATTVTDGFATVFSRRLHTRAIGALVAVTCQVIVLGVASTRIASAGEIVEAARVLHGPTTSGIGPTGIVGVGGALIMAIAATARLGCGP